VVDRLFDPPSCHPIPSVDPKHPFQRKRHQPFSRAKAPKIYSPIAGKISHWWVKEGDFVKKGDTLAKITEIKEDYLDPNLVPRTQEQLNAKKGYLEFYAQKVQANEAQIANLKSSKKSN